MKLILKKQAVITAFVLNVFSILILSKWKIGIFHLDKIGTIFSALCLVWCALSLAFVMFQHWKTTSEHIGGFGYKNLSEWEKFGVVIAVFADVFMTSTVRTGFFIIFFMIYWIWTFRIVHRHVSGDAGYYHVGIMLWVNLVCVWIFFQK